MGKAEDLFFKNLAPSKWKDAGLRNTIGSDPEIGLRSKKTGRQIPAEIALPGSMTSLIGIDGHPDIAEFRPPYAHDPFTHLSYIKRCLFVCRHMLLTYEKANHEIVEGIAGSMAAEDPIGGHLHLGGANPDKPDEFRRLSLLLDNHLMPIITALEHEDIFLERVKGVAHGYSGQYGRLSDARGKLYGIEYRTPPSWLVSESIARGVLVAGWILNVYRDMINIDPPFDSFDLGSYYNYDYPVLRRTALLSLENIMSLSKRHGRAAFLSLAYLKGLIKAKKKWHKGDIFPHWNFFEEEFSPPIISVHPLQYWPFKKFLKDCYRSQLPFPILFELSSENNSKIEVRIDATIAPVFDRKIFADRIRHSNQRLHFPIDYILTPHASNGGVEVITPQCCTEFRILYEVLEAIRKTVSFEAANTNNADIRLRIDRREL